MNQDELSRDELLKMLPKMDHRKDPRSNEGGPIPARKAAARILAYDKFINDPTPKNLQGQTFTIGFNNQRLIEWLQQNSSDTATVQVYLTLDEDNMLNVVFWRYNLDGLPTVKPESTEDKAGGTMMLSDPYNIGGRRP